MLDSLDITGAVITIDAMGMQTNIALQIIEAEGDYVLSLKKNQKALWEDARDTFTIKTIKAEEDASFGEDHCRTRRVYAPVNLNVLRKLALGIVKAQKDKLSVKK